MSPLSILVAFAAMAQQPGFTPLPGDAFRDAILARGVKAIEESSPAMVGTAEQARRLIPQWRQRLLESLGLQPLPARAPLKATTTKSARIGDAKVENLVFQSAPGLFVTGNLWLPANGNGPFPAILYVCGHATEIIVEKSPTGERRIVCGSKARYQHHGRWFAENGFACLVIDTLQLGEIEGLHHGTHGRGMWWWQSRGYTPAGVELWNAMRALDYLQSRPEVDAERLGVTGRSGGGATSWWLASTDERVKAAVPVAGLGDLRAHVLAGEQDRYLRGCVPGHCDCMYHHNVGRIDYSHVIAMCAPRAMLLGNSDADPIFPVGGYRRPAESARNVFKLLGAGEKLALMETAGGHTDTPELQKGASEWFKRWLKNDNTPALPKPFPKVNPADLKALAVIPAEERNTTAHEWFVPGRRHPSPTNAAEARAWLAETGPEMIESLRRTTFGAWPFREPIDPPRLVARVHRNGMSFERYDFATEPGLWLPALVVSGPKSSDRCDLRLLDQTDWDSSNLFEIVERGKAPDNFNLPDGTTLAMLPCRGLGPTRWNDTQRLPNGGMGPFMMERRLALIGETTASGRVWDIVRCVSQLSAIPATSGQEIRVIAKGDLAACAIHAMLFTPGIKSAMLAETPVGHRQGPAMLHALRFADLPQYAGLASAMGNRRITFQNATEKDWEWAKSLSTLSGQGSIQVQP